jgi:hypothetical protein
VSLVLPLPPSTTATSLWFNCNIILTDGNHWNKVWVDVRECHEPTVAVVPAVCRAAVCGVVEVEPGIPEPDLVSVLGNVGKAVEAVSAEIGVDVGDVELAVTGSEM